MNIVDKIIVGGVIWWIISFIYYKYILKDKEE
jgi:hypothetical protein